MNRICRLGFCLLTAAMIALTTLGAQRLLLVPCVYDSVFVMGQRLGTVLPQGLSLWETSKENDHRVVLHPVSHKLTLVRDLDDRDPGGGVIRSLGRPLLSFDPLVAALISLVYLVAMMLSWLNSRWGATSGTARGIRPWALAAAMGLSLTACVLCSGGVTGMRIFWTGVNEAFTRRSIIQIPGSKSVHINGDMLLAMSSTELALMLAAMSLTAFPLLVMINAWTPHGESAGPAGAGRERSGLGQISPPAPAGNRIRRCALRWAGAWYVLITLMLWSAPWSITMAQLLWRGA